MGVFSIFNEKKQGKAKKETPSVARYYRSLAVRTTVLRYFCILLTALVVVYGFSFRRDVLTIDNLRYMLKFVNLGSDAQETLGTRATFDLSDDNVGALFKGDVAVLNGEGLSIYSWDSEKTLAASFQYDHPKMISTPASLFCCDIGGNELRVFNSYSQLYAQSYEYPIYWLAAAENGSYAVLTSAKGYRSGIYVYDEYFRQVYAHLFGDKYIDYAALSRDGKEFVTAAHYVEGGGMVTLLMRFSVSSEEPLFQASFPSELPFGVFYMENGAYALLTSKALRIYDAQDTMTAEIIFGEKSLLGYEFSDKYAIITYNIPGLSGGTELIVYRPDGTIAATRSFDGALLDKKLENDRLAVLTPGALTICDLTGGAADQIRALERDVKQIFLSEGKVYTFTGGEAQILD